MERMSWFFVVLLAAWSFGPVWGEDIVCTNSCSRDHPDRISAVANDGQCDDGTEGSEFSICPCGTDCGDCGKKNCTGDDDSLGFLDDEDCPSGYRTCTSGPYIWCCDRSSIYERCSDSVGFCKRKLSKKAKKAYNVIAIVLAVCIPLALIACCIVAVYYSYNSRGDDIDEDYPGAVMAPVVIPPQQPQQQVEIPTVQATIIPEKEVETPPLATTAT